MRLAILLCLVIHLHSYGQYAPVAGQPGTTAIHKDSSIFKGWATTSIITRGLQQINDPGYGYATTGDSLSATGKAGLNGVVSLGDGGIAVVTFDYAIKNESGYDFAIFENGINDQFLELALVEVSSDGINYFEFESSSLTDTSLQTGSFGYTDATKINNLAGKYRSDYGTPFDLDELTGIPGLNIDSVTHIKITDVVGCLYNSYAKYDSQGRKINDPWPTPFPSSGFDLDAVGIINNTDVSGINENQFHHVSIYPNPAKTNSPINIITDSAVSLAIYSISGKLIYEYKEAGSQIVITQPGVYLLRLQGSGFTHYQKLIITQ